MWLNSYSPDRPIFLEHGIQRNRRTAFVCDQRSEGSTLMFRFQWLLSLSSTLLVGILAGCEGGDAPGASGTTVSSSPATMSDAVSSSNGEPIAAKPAGVVASIESPEKKTLVADADKKISAGEGSGFPDDEATRMLKEIQQLRIAPLPKEITDLEQAIKARRERNERIVEMAVQVLRLTMSDEARKPQFHQAVGQLLEARFQMALAGTKEDVDTLYEDVKALNDRDPKSIAAAEGVYYLAKFSHTRAAQHGRTQPDWFESTSRFAREFADRFPEQTRRAVSLLFGAARTCELQAMATTDATLATRLLTEGKLCYTALAEKFPNSEQGQEATGALRRLSLTGQKLAQFSGPTADGGFVASDEFPGKPTLIYFWDSESEEFTTEVLPVLSKLRTLLPARDLRIVGVALDEDEAAMNAFMELQSVPGQQIFFANAEQRSWNSPLVRFWGIAESPSIWLVDADGTVVSTTLKATDLEAELRKLFK
jgi:hypothetical protein